MQRPIKMLSVCIVSIAIKFRSHFWFEARHRERERARERSRASKELKDKNEPNESECECIVGYGYSKWQVSNIQQNPVPSMCSTHRVSVFRWWNFLMAFQVAWMRTHRNGVNLYVCQCVRSRVVFMCTVCVCLCTVEKTINHRMSAKYFCCVPLSHVARCHYEFGCMAR